MILTLKQNSISGNWAAVNTGVPHGPILSPLLFLVQINDLSIGMSSNPRLFADDSSLLSVAHDKNTSANEFNNDLLRTRNWPYQ